MKSAARVSWLKTELRSEFIEIYSSYFGIVFLELKDVGFLSGFLWGTVDICAFLGVGGAVFKEDSD